MTAPPAASTATQNFGLAQETALRSLFESIVCGAAHTLPLNCLAVAPWWATATQNERPAQATPPWSTMVGLDHVRVPTFFPPLVDFVSRPLASGVALCFVVAATGEGVARAAAKQVAPMQVAMNHLLTARATSPVKRL